MSYEQMVLQAAKNDFRSFAVYFFPHANQCTKFDENWHIDAIAHQVTRLIAGDARHCLVTMPPRCLKSYMISVALPAFLLGHNPGEKIVVVTYGEQLGDELSEATLRIMESDPYGLIFPKTSLTTRTRRTLKTSLGGQRFSTTIGGAVTGLGGGWLIVDDPLNGPNAYSEALRTQANKFFDETLSTRGDNPTTTRFIVVMQRLHADDLAGHILAQGEWEHLRLQARATEDAIVDLGGGRQHHVRRGDLLHPARLNDAVLARRLKQMGTATFEAQFQQDPLPVTGNQIKYEWLGRYEGSIARGDGIIVQSWDTASKTGVANDTSACTTWLLKDKVSYLLHVWKGKLDFPALREKVISFYHEHGATHLLIEDASSGTALIQDLRVTTPLNVIPGHPSKLSKEARVDGISGALESGRVLFPHDAPWLPDFEREMLAFPAGGRDDQVDSVTQYVSWAMERSGSGLFEFDFGGEERVDTKGLVELILCHQGLW